MTALSAMTPLVAAVLLFGWLLLGRRHQLAPAADLLLDADLSWMPVVDH